MNKKSTLEICRDFYEEYGREMIRKTVPEYENRAAVGLAGEGSECFGFDDDISRDHDFGLGFCIWLTTEDYEKIGSILQKSYTELIEDAGIRYSERVFGPSASIYNPRLDRRRGVMEIPKFYGGILRLSPSLDLIVGKNYWIYAEERFLATAVNGGVFRDDLGEFSKVRDVIRGYYPRRIWLLKIAQELHLFSHSGQSNYPRMMARNDFLTASICIHNTVLSSLRLAFLLNRSYSPYYKWMKAGALRLPRLKEIVPLLEDLSVLPPQTEAWKGVSYSSTSVNYNDKAIVLIEKIAGLISAELLRLGLAEDTEPFLEIHSQRIAQKAAD